MEGDEKPKGFNAFNVKAQNNATRCTTIFTDQKGYVITLWQFFYAYHNSIKSHESTITLNKTTVMFVSVNFPRCYIMVKLEIVLEIFK